MPSFWTFCLSQSIRLCCLSFLDCFKSTISWLTDSYFFLRLWITVFLIIFFFFLRFNFLSPTSPSCIALYFIIFCFFFFFLTFFLLAYLRRLYLISFLRQSKTFSLTKYRRLWSRSYRVLFVQIFFDLLFLSTWSRLLLLCFVYKILKLVYFFNDFLIRSFSFFLSRFRSASSVIPSRKSWVRY